MKSLIIFTLFVYSACLQATVVTFNDFAPIPPQSNGPTGVNTITSGGFEFSSDLSNTDYWGFTILDNGPSGNYLSIDSFPGTSFPIMITHSSGSAFDFASLDILVRHYYSVGPISIVGYDDINNVIASREFLPDPSPLNYSEFINLTFSDEWNAVHRVQINGQYIWPGPPYSDPRTANAAIDNFTASVVPIPGAVWLFGSALVSLAWSRRRQARS